MKYPTLILGLAVICSQCVAQQKGLSFRYKTPPSNLVNSNSATDTFAASYSGLIPKCYDATQLLPEGYVKDGTVDYTKYIQNAINLHPNVEMPDFPVLINPAGVKLNSNSIVLFRDNSKFIVQTSNLPSYSILKLFNVTNVSIYHPHLEGDRETHTGTKGEWGMGIDIRSSSNVNVIDPVVSKCWGDGIYIGANGEVPSKNINIYNARLDYNRRNGISIICANGVKVLSPVITNSFGTLPESGIDVEPNSNQDTEDNILLDNVVTFNSHYGILLWLNKLPGAIDKNVNITINNHLDEGSYTAFCYGGYTPPYNGNALHGNIKVINPVWRNNVKVLRNYENNNIGPAVEFKNIQILKKNSSGEMVSQPDSVQAIKRIFANEKKILVH